jgi:hypothetical protein
MKLHIRMIEIAERDNLPTDHPMRVTAQALQDVLSQKKDAKGFPDTLFEAETNALAAYTAYTGKPFVNTED